MSSKRRRNFMERVPAIDCNGRHYSSNIVCVFTNLAASSEEEKEEPKKKLKRIKK